MERRKLSSINDTTLIKLINFLLRISSDRQIYRIPTFSNIIEYFLFSKKSKQDWTAFYLCKIAQEVSWNNQTMKVFVILGFLRSCART